MRFCDAHWQKTRAAIEARGLTGLVAKNWEEAVGRLVAGAEAGSTASSFDPLNMTFNMILSRALERCGLELMMQNEDGSDRCPLCFMNAVHKEGCKVEDCAFTYDSWIDGASDDALAEAKRLGLVGST